MQNIFVYGTLKCGHEFHYGLANQVFLKDVRTKPLYRMHSLGSYPGLVDADSGDGDSIDGELYCVDIPCRKLLDQIEEVDSGMYELREIHLENAAEFEPVFAYFYLGSVDGCERTMNW